MANTESPQAVKYKPSIDIDSKDNETVKDLKIGDEVVVKATGRVKRLSEDRDYSSKNDKEKVFHASIELSDIKMDNVSAEDRDSAEGEGIEISAFMRAKKAKEKALKAREERYGGG